MDVGVDRKTIGDQAEALALEAYLRRDARLLARNFRVKCGELDLVLEESNPEGRLELVIVEVRARDPSRAWETPAESLTPQKLRRIRNASALFLRDYDGPARDVRFDLASWDGESLRIHPNFWWY